MGKVGLKFNIQKTKIVVFSPIILWQIDGENVKTVTDFTFLDSKITADGDCSHKIKKHLLLGRKAMTNLVLKIRDITLPTKVHIIKAIVSSIIMYGCELDHKKVERETIDAFELWFWRRLLRVPWRARRSNQSILKEINPEYSLEGLMLKLQFQYFGHLLRRANSLEKTWFWENWGQEKKRSDRGWDGWMASPTYGTWVWENSSRSEGWGSLACCILWGHKESDTT